MKLLLLHTNIYTTYKLQFTTLQLHTALPNAFRY